MAASPRTHVREFREPNADGRPIGASRRIKIPTSLRIFGRAGGISRRDAIPEMRLSFGRMGGELLRGSKLEVTYRPKLRGAP